MALKPSIVLQQVSAVGKLQVMFTGHVADQADAG